MARTTPADSSGTITACPLEPQPSRSPDPSCGDRSDSFDSTEFETSGEAASTSMSLNEDPQTSPVGSLYLHLLSEHGAYHALDVDEQKTATAHERLHARESDHDVHDWRFRSARAVAASVFGAHGTGNESDAALI